MEGDIQTLFEFVYLPYVRWYLVSKSLPVTVYTHWLFRWPTPCSP